MPADVVGEPLIDVIRPLIEHDATASIDERGQAERGQQRDVRVSRDARPRTAHPLIPRR
jgi:uncharacterized protein (DUF2461 family)